MASKPASNPGQFTRINSNPLLISAQKQMLVVEEAKKKKKEEEKKEKIGEDIPDWQSVRCDILRNKSKTRNILTFIYIYNSTSSQPAK